MGKNILLAVWVAGLLTACISIKPVAQATATAAFVTATLAPTKVALLAATSTTSPPTYAPAAPTITNAPNCTNAAILLQDVTIPDNIQINAGETFTKTWEFQNTGTCTWTNYTIHYASGDALNAPLSTPIPETLPNAKVQVSVELTAPTADGRYTGYFTLLTASGETISIGTEKTFWVKFVVGALTVNSGSSGAIPVPAGNCSYGPNAGYVNELVALINAARAEAGKPALTFNAEIAAFAQKHAEDMAYNNFLSHAGSEGSFGERIAGYNSTHFDYRIYGEILAIGLPQDAMAQWRQDAHWDFLFYDNTQIGAGYAYNSCSDFGGYFTVNFGY